MDQSIPYQCEIRGNDYETCMCFDEEDYSDGIYSDPVYDLEREEVEKMRKP